MADNTIKNATYNVRNSLVSYYLLVMFTVFPLFMWNQYVQIRHDKFYFFLAISAILILSVGGVSIAYAFAAPAKRKQERSFLPLTIPDFAMFGFFLFAAVSTVLSDYPLDSFTGNAGRNNGLLLLAVYLIVYLIISRWYVFKEYVLAAYMVGSIIVTGLVVINFFYLDPLHFYDGYSSDVIEDFASTIGNKNTIASFVCLCLPVAAALVVFCAKRWLRILSGVCVGVGYMGLLCANSLSGFLGLIAMVLFLFIVSARSYEHLRRFMLTMAIVCLSGHLLRLLLLIAEITAGDGAHKAFESIPKALLYSPLTVIPTVVFAALFAAMTLGKPKLEPRYPKKGVFVCGIVLAALTVLLIGGSFVWFSFVDTATDLGALERLLRFSDRWGTHRGFMWINGMEDYASFPLIKQLFGSGPDTFYHVFEPHFEELAQRFGDTSTNCIHSEYLNYLVTQGALGLLAYLALIGSVFVRALKAVRKDPIIAVFAAAVLCYALQATVNLYQPLTTPLFILLLAMCEALNRRSLLQ